MAMKSEPEKEQQEPVKVPCEHDPRPYAHIMPVYVDPATHETLSLPTGQQCPFYAPVGSRFCWAHMVFNDSIPEQLHAETQDFLRNVLHYYALGLMIMPQLPNGNFWQPPWWKHRFN